MFRIAVIVFRAITCGRYLLSQSFAIAYTADLPMPNRRPICFSDFFFFISKHTNALLLSMLNILQNASKSSSAISCIRLSSSCTACSFIFSSLFFPAIVVVLYCCYIHIFVHVVCCSRHAVHVKQYRLDCFSVDSSSNIVHHFL